MAIAPDTREVTIEPEGLRGLLGVPDAAEGIVIFAHGSGSGRLSPRNNYVAQALRSAGLATLLVDLLTKEEETDRHNVFDIDLLATRLARATSWAADERETHQLVPLYFGASTGAAAALTTAAGEHSNVAAVVSRGGRPDLAMDALARVRAPTLLLVGSLDTEVIAMNERALEALTSEKRLEIIGGAGHLFEEPGTLDQVISEAAEWFLHHLEAGGKR